MILITPQTDKRQVKITGEETPFQISLPTVITDGETGALKLPDHSRFIGLCIRKFFWNLPFYTKSPSEIRPETQLLLFKTARKMGALLPLCGKTFRSTIQGGQKGTQEIVFEIEGTAEAGETFALYGEIDNEIMNQDSHKRNNIYHLVENLIKKARSIYSSFHLRSEKPLPAFFRTFGWCTWDAFYTDVNAQKVKKGLKSLCDVDVKPEFMILDDGWLETDELFLSSFSENRKKFPEGLKEFIKQVKETFGIKIFGVWHTFQGYWAGIKPGSEIEKMYSPHHSEAVVHPWASELTKAKRKVTLIPRERVGDFYQDFYQILKTNGVDMVKNDGQSAHKLFTRGVEKRVPAMRTWQKAFQSAAAFRFGVESLHCMSNTSDVFFHLSSANAIRNSQDYFPGKDASVQRTHIHSNAYNALYASHFAWPDWDMFQSNRIESFYHAAARAVSGGPVYISDRPGDHNGGLIRKLLCDAGRVLRCEKPAIPSPSSVFTDTSGGEAPLFITNRTKTAAVVAAFNASKDRDVVSGTCLIEELPEVYEILEKVKILTGSDPEGLTLWDSEKQCAETVSFSMYPKGEIKAECGPLGWKIISLIPRIKKFSFIGKPEAFNPTAAIKEVLPCGKTGVTVILSHILKTFFFIGPVGTVSVYKNGHKAVCSRVQDTEDGFALYLVDTEDAVALSFTAED